MQAQTPAQLAANDDRFLDLAINFLFDHVRYEYIDDMAIALCEYEQSPTIANERNIRNLAYKAGVTSVWKIIQQFRNSNEYQDLLAEFEPVLPTQQKQAIVAVAATAKAIADNSSTKASKSKPKQAKVLPMPAAFTCRLEGGIADLEAMSRKELVEATKALKSNNPDITLRANAASVELKKLLSLHILKVEYIEPTKASKGKQKPAIALELPEGLTWDKVKLMKYRELQQLAKALKSHGRFSGNIGGKGATSEALRDGICQAFGFEKGVEVAYTKKPKAELDLPSWNAYAEQKRLEREATELSKAAA